MFIVWRKKLVKGTGGHLFLAGPARDRNMDCRPAWRCRRCEHTGAGRVAWTALVMQSTRIDGKPRQKLLYRFLTIRSCCIADPVNRAAWWYDTLSSINGWVEWAYQDRNIKALCENLSRDRAAMIAKLREVVPKPTSADAKAFARFASEAETTRNAEFDDAFRVYAAKQEQDRINRGGPEPESFKFWRDMFGKLNGTAQVESTDDYAVLGLTSGATWDEVKAAHRQLAMKHHPDRAGQDGSSEADFCRIQTAYERIQATAATAGSSGE